MQAAATTEAHGAGVDRRLAVWSGRTRGTFGGGGGFHV